MQAAFATVPLFKPVKLFQAGEDIAQLAVAHDPFRAELHDDNQQQRNHHPLDDSGRGLPVREHQGDRREQAVDDGLGAQYFEEHGEDDGGDDGPTDSLETTSSYNTDSEITAGTVISLDIDSNDEVDVIWTDEDEQSSTTLATYEGPDA